MGEIETQTIGFHQRALLLRMFAEHGLQGLVQKVRGGMMAGCGQPGFALHLQGNLFADGQGAFQSTQMNNPGPDLLHIINMHFAIRTGYHSPVSNPPAAFAVRN